MCNLKPFDLICMSLDYEMDQDHPEEIHISPREHVNSTKKAPI